MIGRTRRLLGRILPARVQPAAWVARWVLRCTGGRVHGGPFEGLRLSAPTWNAHAAKLVGVYERELHPSLERLRASRGWIVVNIGAADGYYAVGLARWPTVDRVHAFELDPRSRGLLLRNATLNGVADKVRVEGACTPAGLEAALAGVAGPVLVLCDVEGYEDRLLDPGAHPALVRCHLLVEVHEVLVPGVGRRLAERFRVTHDLEVIEPGPRRRQDFPFETGWTRRLKDFHVVSAIGDGRPGGILWHMMTPRARPSGLHGA